MGEEEVVSFLFFSFLRIGVISTYTRGYRGVLTLDGFQVKAPL